MSVADTADRVAEGEASKEAYIALLTLGEFENAVPARVDAVVAEQLNHLLSEIRSVFATDPAFARSISHIEPLRYEAHPAQYGDGVLIAASDNAAELRPRARMMLAELKGKLKAFLAIHMPTEEKNRMRFHQ